MAYDVTVTVVNDAPLVTVMTSAAQGVQGVQGVQGAPMVYTDLTAAQKVEIATVLNRENSHIATKLAEGRTIATTGDVVYTSGSFDGTGNVTGVATLANSGVVAGSYNKVTVDNKGRVTDGSNPTTLAGYGITNAVEDVHVGSGASAHSVATTEVHGFMHAEDKDKLDTVARNANAYVLPTALIGTLGGIKLGWQNVQVRDIQAATHQEGRTYGIQLDVDGRAVVNVPWNADPDFNSEYDGGQYVPSTGTTSEGKVLMAGAAAGSASWVLPTKEHVGLENVDNTSDVNKPVSTAVQLGLDSKVDVVTGKALSTNDFTDVLKSKLDGIADSANNYVHPASGVTAGTYTKLTVDVNGHATVGDYLVTADIPNLDASKITTGMIDAARLPSYVDDVLEYADLVGFPVTGEAGKIYVALNTNKAYRWSGSVYVHITSGAVDSVAGKTGVVALIKADVGLENVDNTSDVNKPISTATQTEITRIDGRINGITTTQVAEGDKLFYTDERVDDRVKDLFVAGTNVSLVYDDEANSLTISANDTSIGWSELQSVPTTVEGYGITDVYTKTAVDTKVTADIKVHTDKVDNPHSVTKAQVGLSDVDNTSDANKPISTAAQTALDDKVTKNADIVAGTSAKITYDAKGLVTGGADLVAADIPIIAAAGVSVAAVGSISAATVQAAIEELDSEKLSVAVANASYIGRADKYLAAQSVMNMLYTDGKLSKVRYNIDTDTDYEILTYSVDGKLDKVAHYVATVLKGNTTLVYSSGKLISAIYAAV